MIQNQEKVNKGLLILYGESFRTGGQFSRIRGQDESFSGQIAAANSHMIFIDYLKMFHNIDIDVYIVSYNTKFNEHLVKQYSNKLIGYKFYNDVMGYNNLICNATSELCDNINTYDFILYMRIDLHLKHKFSEIFNPFIDKVLFPTICWKCDYITVNNHPRVNDLMMFIPKKYFDKLDIFCKYLCHNIWDIFVENKILTYDDLDVMINTFHDSDSAKDFNPLYYIVNRPENPVQHTPSNEIFDKYNFP